jgi:cell division protein FtsB
MNRKFKALKKLTVRNRVCEAGDFFNESEVIFDLKAALENNKCEEIKQEGAPEVSELTQSKKISKLNKEIEKLKKENSKLKDEIKTLKLKVDSGESSELIENLEEENETLGKQVIELQGDIASLEQANETLKKAQGK